MDDVNVRLHVQLGFVLAVGLYDGAIDNKVIAEHVKEMLTHGQVEQFIENVQIVNVELDDGTVLAANSGP